jgi:putative SOS response-associated peptidase YedK
MPLILSDADAMRWFGDQPLTDDELLRLCRPPPEDNMQFVELAAKPKEEKPKKITKSDLSAGQGDLLL